jgi:amino acid permease
MLVIWLFVYSETVTNDSASYLQTAGVTEGLLSANPFYGLAIVAFLVLVAFASKIPHGFHPVDLSQKT